MINSIRLRPVEPQKDFGAIASLLSSQEEEPSSASAVRADYDTHLETLVGLMVAMDERGELLGFYWAWHSLVESGQVSFHLLVRPDRRKQGIGQLLYEDLTQILSRTQVKKVRVNMCEPCAEGLEFSLRRGFYIQRHQIGMELDLQAFDDRLYDTFLEHLKSDGFRFTSMAELCNTPEAQRRLYVLNDSASASTPGQEGEHAWATFEDFQKSVCQSDWYIPAGQIVAIESLSGEWVAMSAITRMQGREYAYNLFTGVDLAYRGRKLGQAVKVLALRYAREVIKVGFVRTHHNAQNLPMIAIDRKFGYRQLPGTFLLEKMIDLN